MSSSTSMCAGRLLRLSRRPHACIHSNTLPTAPRTTQRSYTPLSRPQTTSHSCPRNCPLCSSAALGLLPARNSSRLCTATTYSAILSSSSFPASSSSFHTASRLAAAAQPAPASSAPSASAAIPAGHQSLFEQGLLPSPTAVTTPTQRVRDLFTELTELSQFEMAQLHNLLNKSYGVPTSSRTNFGLGQAGGMQGQAAPAGGAAQPSAAAAGGEAKAEAAAEAKAAQTAFSVRLDGFNAADKIKVIKEVRTATGLGLKESKELVEGAPKTIKKDLSKADCDALVAKLKEAGAKVTVE